MLLWQRCLCKWSIVHSSFANFGPCFGLYINFSKCELYWPCGDNTFPDFHPAIKRINPESGGLESPVWSHTSFFDSLLSTHLDKILAVQDKLTLLEDPQVELHLLRSCLSVCKVTHILRCVPTSSLGTFPFMLTSKL